MCQLYKRGPLDLDERGALPRLRLGDRECGPPPDGAVEILARDGELRLPCGSYEFQVQSFSLEAGKHGPGTGSVYAAAPLSGRLSGPVGKLLRNAAKNPQAPQQQVQSLIWAIMSRSGYHQWSPDLRRVAEGLLGERDLIILGKNYWRFLPEPLRELALRPLRALLEGIPLWGELGREAARWRQLISTAQTTYQELERAFIRLGRPPGEPESRFSRGDWSLMPGGCFVRLFPDSYTTTRMQVYVPEPAPAALERDRLGRATRLSMDELAVAMEYADHSRTGGLSLGNRHELPVWWLRRVTLRATVAGGTEEVSLETPDVGWIARDYRQLAALDPSRHPELAGRIETARALGHDRNQLSNLSRGASGRFASAPAKSPTPLEELTDLGHYHNGLEAIIKDFRNFPSNREKVKWLVDHFGRLPLNSE